MNIKKLISGILAAGMVFAQLPAASALESYDVMEAPLNGYALDTPEENLFYLEGYTNGFILLDVGISDESKFLVMTRETYGNVQFDADATQKFDVNDPNNVAYFLNNEFINRTYNNIPPEVVKHINKNHTWVTEAGSAAGNCTEEYETTCGISLMSMTEFELYNGIYGIQDGMSVGWWLRTPRGKNSLPKAGLSVRVSNDAYLARAFEYFTDGLEAVRPLFWLDKNFFEDVRLDVEKTGANVAKKLTEVYSAGELQNGGAKYANHEMRKFGFEVDGIDEVGEISFNNAPSYIMDQKNAFFEVEMNITGTETITYDVEYTDGDKKYSEKMQVPPKKKTVKKFTLENLPKGVHEITVTVLNDGRKIKSSTALVGIVDFYEPQFMEEYNRSMMSTHFLFNGQTDRTEIDIMKKIGVLEHRDEIYWSGIEPQKGVWDFSSPDTYMNWVKDAGLKSMIIVDFSNQNHVPDKTGGADPTKTAPRTQEELAAFCEYVKQILNRYPNIWAIEIWNETNWGFWQPEPNALDYATMVKAVSMAAHEVRPDIYVIAGSLVYISGLQYFYDLFGENILPYVDSISSHPYVFPLNADPALPDRLTVGVDIFDAFGGFKDHVVSEVGLTTSSTSMGSTDRVQAKELVKNYVYNDAYNVTSTCWYNFRDKGDNPADNEHNFGIINRDYTAKDAFITLSQRNNRLNGSVYQGQVNLGTGIQAHLYSKDGEQMMIAWKESGTIQLEIPNSGVEDMFGNPTGEGDMVTLKEEPVYILGLKDDYYAKAAGYTANKYYNRLADRWPVLKDSAELAELKNLASELNRDTSLADIKAAFDKNNQFAENVINSVREKSLEVSDRDMMSMLNDIWLAQVQWANLYAARKGGTDHNDISQKYSAVKQKIEEKISVEYFATMCVSEELLRQAKRYFTKAEEIAAMRDNPGKEQAVIFNDVMAEVLSGWADLVSDFEKVDENTAVMIYSDPSRMSVYQGESEEIKVTVENRKRKSLEGVEIVIKDDEGNEVSRTDKFSTESGKSQSVDAEVKVPGTKLRGEYKYSLELVKDGETLSKRSIYVNVKGVIDVKMQEADKAVSSLKSIKVKVDNIYNKPLALQIDIKGPEGWSFTQSSKPVRVNSNSTATVEFEVSKKQKYPFNNYSFEVTAQDRNGNILYQEKKPLDMPVITENTAGIAPEEFTGDMSSWSDAYPVYLNAPENPDKKESWDGLDISARVYSKWDQNYFYFIADVNDETFIQSFSKSAVWNNDSIQVSWDTLNDKAEGAYRTDDYEFGFSLTSAGNEVWGYFDGTNTFGEKPSEWLKVIRDNTKKITRYYARIPLESLTPLKPAQGKKIGFNIAVNDADLTTRDDQIYLTPGTGSPINPKQFMTFTFQKSDTKLEEADVEPPLYVQVQENYEKTAPVFEDIAGHWGQADIQALAEKNIVSGFDGKFYPEDDVTRAEFLKLLLAALDIQKEEPKNVFADVANDAWYAGYIQAAYNRGAIPAEMTGDGFLPNQPITREEMAVLVCNAAMVTGSANVDSLNVFKDKDSISEWTQLYVARAVKAGILYGDDTGNYHPGDACTRAEAAAIIKRVYDKK